MAQGHDLMTADDYRACQAEIVIAIPMLPPRECSPNWSGHWRYRARAVQEWRQCAFLAALAIDLGAEFAMRPDDPVVMDIAVAWWRNRKRMDSDNLVAACKPARDGIADAFFGGKDNRIQIGKVTQTRGDGVTIITLRGDS